MEWPRYVSIVQDFDALLEHGKSQSSALVGLRPGTRRRHYAEQIFVKMLGHALTLRQMSPDPERKAPRELWDLSSSAAIARCIIEAYEAFSYIALGTDDAQEQQFRVQLWELHDVSRRTKMTQAMGISGEKVDAMVRSESARKEAIINHPFFPQTSPRFQADVRRDDPPPFHLSRRERCEAGGLSYGFLNGASTQLSQYVHTLPMSIHQLMPFRAGSPDALSMMGLPIQHASIFLCRASIGMAQVFGDAVPKPTDALLKLMRLWTIIATRGLKDIQVD